VNACRIVPTATHEEWLAARRRGVSASEIAPILGLSPRETGKWASAFDLYLRKTGQIPDEVEETDAMAFGKFAEPFIADRFRARFPDFYVVGDGQTLYQSADRPWQLATPDRLVYEGCGHPDSECDCGEKATILAVLQCKTAARLGDGWGEEGSGEVPVHYRAQVLQECDVTGAGTAFLALWLTQGFRLLVYEITIGEDELADMKLMREAAVEFRARVDNNDPPDVDSLPATTRALKTLHPSVEDAHAVVGPGLARQWRAACERVELAKDRKRLVENRLRASMGSARRAVVVRNGRVAEEIARRDVSDVPAKVIRQEDVGKVARKAFTLDRLVQVGGKDEA